MQRFMCVTTMNFKFHLEFQSLCSIIGQSHWSFSETNKQFTDGPPAIRCEMEAKAVSAVSISPSLSQLLLQINDFFRKQLHLLQD